jgi:hypothetical protein
MNYIIQSKYYYAILQIMYIIFDILFYIYLYKILYKIINHNS